MRRSLGRVLLFGAVVGLGLGCGGGVKPSTDASTGTVDAMTGSYDAPPQTPDAAVSTTAPREGTEVTNAGGRVTGGGVTIDVQMGHWFGQGPTSGGGTTVEGGAMIK